MNKKRNQTIGRRLAWLLTFILVMEGMLQNAGILTARAEEAAGSGTAQPGIEVTQAEGYAEGAYAEWKPVAGADGYLVYVSQVADQNHTSQDGRDMKEVSESEPLQREWTRIDDELIRSYEDYIRADALGLTEGIWYLKIVAGTFDSERKQTGTVAEVVKEVTVTAHDRSGYAWVNGTASGAYNEDGSLKENARVIYITEETKNTVRLEVAGASANPCEGLQAIMNGYKNAQESRPLAVRIIGNITDPAVLSSGDLAVETSTTNKPGITIEGVGEDAVVNGWGISIKNSSNVEVRNLGFMNCNSGEGDNVSLVQGNDHIWVHNCDMFYGAEGSDDDQKKGDGALDCKWSDYVTFSYNHFWDSGKCNLLGLEEKTNENLHITYHHNWYDHSDSRHPRVRFYTVHVYNNYYDGNSKYGIGGARGGGSIFAENNYFRNCKYPMLISMQGSDVYGGGSGTFSKEDGSIIKAYGNYMEGQTRFMPYKAQDDPNTAWDDRVEFDAYVAESRDEIVPDTVKTVSASETVVFKEGCTGGNTYNNFDTADDFYTYQADPAEAVPKIVAEYAGRLNGGDFKWDFNNETADTSYAVDVELQEALKNYTSKLEFVGGIMGASTKINCTVTFDPGNGEAVTEVTVEVNQTVAQPENPTKIPEGKVSFDGWYHGDVKWNFSDKVTGDMTLVGKWYAEGEEPEEIIHGGTPIGTEKIIHDFTQSGLSSKYFAITGEMHSKSNSGQTVEYDGKVYKGKGLVLDSSTEIKFFTTTQSAKLVLLIRFYSENKKIIIDGVNYKSTPGMIEAQLGSGEHTIKGSGSDYLFAMIVIPEGESVIPIYTITLDPANGTAVKTIVLVEGKEITEEDLPTPTKEGYTFQGWVDEEDKSITVPYKPTKSMTIKAKWQRIIGEDEYVITIDKQDSKDPVEKVIKIGTELTEEDLPSTLTREGYTFQGWVDEDGNAITVPYKPTKSMMIKAKWQSNTAKIGLHVELVAPDATYVYTGSAIKPAIIVTNNGEQLIEGVDYTVKYSNNIKACEWKQGEAAPKNAPKITVTGKGNLTGSTFTNFRIAWKSISEADDAGGTDSVKAGGVVVVKGSKAEPVLVYNGMKLGKNDYKVVETTADASGKFAASGTIKLEGQNNFTGSRTINVDVVESKQDLPKLKVTVNKVDYTYKDGKVHDADVTVTGSDNATLTPNEDYTIVYNTEDRESAGTVKFVVVGLGKYSGTVAKSFVVKPRKADLTAELKDNNKKYPFSSAGVTVGDDLVVKDPGLNGAVLELGKDYKVSYSNNKKVSENAKYTVTFLGNYKGSRAVSGIFKIKAVALNNQGNEQTQTMGLKIELADKIYKKPGLYKSVPYVTLNGVALKKSDYKVDYYLDDKAKETPMNSANKVTITDDANCATVYVKITGKGNYASAEGEYVIESYKVWKVGKSSKGEDQMDLSRARVTFYDKAKYDKDGKETDAKKVTKLSYTGKEITPGDAVVEIKVGKTWVTVPASQYNVVYVNNVNKGKATAIITATGDEYVGSKTATFSIVARHLKNDEKGLLDNLFKVIGK